MHGILLRALFPAILQRAHEASAERILHWTKGGAAGKKAFIYVLFDLLARALDGCVSSHDVSVV